MVVPGEVTTPPSNNPTTTVSSDATPSGGATTATTSGGGSQGPFEIDRVRLFDPSDLPAGDVPLPVPLGGDTPGLTQVLYTIDEETVLHVRYRPEYFRTAAAFYQTLIARDGHVITDSMLFPTSAHWILLVDGEKVQVRVTALDDYSHLEITYLGSGPG